MATKLINGLNTLVFRVGEKDGIAYQFSLKSKQTNEVINSECIDLSPIYPYLTFAVDLHDILEGEYDYTIITPAGKLIRSGIAYVELTKEQPSGYVAAKTYTIYERYSGKESGE